MIRILVDEDLPRSLAPRLRAEGFDAVDVRDIGLRSAPDHQIFSRSLSDGSTLVTGDLGFSDLVRFPLGTHFGVVIVRCPNELPADARVREVVDALRRLDERDLPGAIVIVEPGRVRVRRPR